MKKQFKLALLSASMLLIASTASFADGNYKGESYKGYKDMPCPQLPRLKDGFYLGAQVGYDSYRARVNTTTTLGADVVSINPPINAVGFVGGLLAGYGQYVNEMFYLGGEVFVNDSGAESSTNVTVNGLTATSKVTANLGYGVSLLPGYKLNDESLLYIRLGYNWSQMKIQGSSPTGGSASRTNTVGGFNYGLGLESLIYQNWSVRTEYTHTNYSSFSASTANIATTVSPADNQFMLALIYHFA